jgi:cell wall-associated NlpC family hydrolase
MIVSCKSTSSINTTKKRTSKSSSNLCQKIVDEAVDNVGVPYLFGGTTKSGYDCSGLVFTAFKHYEILLPRTSFEMAKQGEIINRKEAKVGDLIFFKTNEKNQINHVGLIVSIDDDEIKFVHSSTKLGVIISSTKEVYFKKSFAQINRIII